MCIVCVGLLLKAVRVVYVNNTLCCQLHAHPHMPEGIWMRCGCNGHKQAIEQISSIEYTYAESSESSVLITTLCVNCMPIHFHM